jgi:drug/metabolite transporter (DMT)-like permease
MARVLSESFSVPVQVGIRSAVVLTLVVIVLKVRKSSLRIPQSQQWRAGVLGLTFGATGLLYTVAANNTKLSNVVFIFLALGPVSSVVLARVMFGEVIHRKLLMAIGLTVCGILVISPPTSAMDLGVLAAIGAGILSGGSNIARRWLKDVDWMIVVVYQSAVTVVLGAVFELFNSGDAVHDVSVLPVAMVFVSAVSTLLVSAMLLYGYKHIDVGTGSLILSTELIFVVVLGWLAYDEVPTLAEWCGCALISAGTVLAVKRRGKRAVTYSLD